MTDLLPLLLLGGLLGLDVVSFPQMMISRPLVAATIAGAFVGHAGNGILAGAALELIALATLPFGASRYPEWGSAAVVAGAIAGVLHTDSSGVLTVAVLSGLATTLGATTVGFLVGSSTVATFGLGGYAVFVIGIAALIPPIRMKQLRWAGPRLPQLRAGAPRWAGAAPRGRPSRAWCGGT